VGAAIGYVLQKVLRQGLDWYFNRAIAQSKKLLAQEITTEEERITISWALLAAGSCPDLYAKSYMPFTSRTLDSEYLDPSLGESLETLRKSVRLFTILWKKSLLARGVMELTLRGDLDPNAECSKFYHRNNLIV